MNPPPTLKDIAQRLGLSIATVSRALQDSHEIGAATKSKVMELAKELNYSPNPYASSLRKRTSKTIAVVLPEVADSFFSLAINGIESVAIDKGYHVLIYLTHESKAREKSILAEFKSGRVDGLLISVSEETDSGEHVKEVMDSGIPVVFFDRVCEEVEASRVTTNDFECGRLAAQHLAEQGCQRIFYLCTSPSVHISKKRMDGYKTGLEEAGLRFSDSDIIVCNNNLEENCRIIETTIKKENGITGIIASVEKLTTPVYLACRKMGVHIPTEMKLLSFTNLQASVILNPSLTTITQPAFEMGAAAATELFKKLDKKKRYQLPQNIVIESALIARESSLAS